MIREAGIPDIPEIQLVRNSVKENRLSDPALVSDDDVAGYITRRGKGWVYLSGGIIRGFAIADLEDQNVWALFIHPDFEGKGIGRKLHDEMLKWYFSTGKEFIWLGTSPGTRAEKFYRLSGWREAGKHGKDETRFEMTREEWEQRSHTL